MKNNRNKRTNYNYLCTKKISKKFIKDIACEKINEVTYTINKETKIVSRTKVNEKNEVYEFQILAFVGGIIYNFPKKDFAEKPFNIDSILENVMVLDYIQKQQKDPIKHRLILTQLLRLESEICNNINLISEESTKYLSVKEIVGSDILAICVQQAKEYVNNMAYFTKGK